MGRGRTARRAVAAAIALTVVAAGVGSCGRAHPGARPDLHGASLEVVGVWSGTEQQRFERVLRGFEQETGAKVTYVSGTRRLTEVLGQRLAASDPPDLAMLPQPGLLRQYARDGVLVPVGPAAREAVERNYSTVWQDLASVDGRLYGVYFKAADKSLVWYDLGTFERAGVVPPQSLDGLLAVARDVRAAGVPAFSVGAGDGWVLTDWFESIYLRQAGPGRYDLLADHRLPWTDPSVKDALRRMKQFLAPDLLAGGVAGSLGATFEQSVQRAFAPTAGAAMVVEGDFVAGTITGATTAKLGVDADVFGFPSASDSGAPVVVGGGDVAVLMRPSAAGQALLAYLASPGPAALWAAQGGFVSPNLNLDLSVYPDDITRSIARAVLDAGDNFRFDLSDQQPAQFGNMADRGMRKILQDFLVNGDVDGTAARLEAEATAAYGR